MNTHCINSADLPDSAGLPDDQFLTETDISDLPPPPPYSVATLGMGMHDPDATIHPPPGHSDPPVYTSPPSYEELMQKEDDEAQENADRSNLKPDDVSQQNAAQISSV